MVRRVDVDADEIDRTGDGVHVALRNRWRVVAGGGEERSRVLPFENGGEVGRIEFARGFLGRRDVLGRFDHRHADGDVFGKPHAGAGARSSADCLNG